MSDVITYPLSAAIELCEQLDNNLPTPETDDLARGNHVVPTEWAQQLERERDEALEKIKRQANRIRYLEGATNHACGTPLSVALRERDEARAGREDYKQLAIKHAQERDEAVKEVKLLKAILDLIKKDVS